MRTVTAQDVQEKQVLLRLDTDVPIKDGKVIDPTRLKAGIPTLKLCLENTEEVIVMGHVGRPARPALSADRQAGGPGGKIVPELSIKPVAEWLENSLKGQTFKARLHILENLRFESGEDEANIEYAKQLASLGDVFVNESFASHHKAASTTVLPTLFPSFAGLRFAKEVEVLSSIRNNPKKPLVVIIGGVKVEDKYPAIVELSKIADAVLVGGSLAQNIKEQNLEVAPNVMVGKLSENGIDMAPETIESFASVVKDAKQIVWAGPLGKYEDSVGNKGTLDLAKAVILSGAEVVLGGGDTVAALNFYLDKFSFVSTGGGAMLKLLTEGTLPTIQALTN